MPGSGARCERVALRVSSSCTDTSRRQPRPTLFGELTDDVSNHEYLALRVRALGHPRTRNSYFVNLQTDGPITTDLWQHRLFFRRDDGDWEDIFVSAQLHPHGLWTHRVPRSLSKTLS